uniref:Uncharacterized protein n=1 Tax=Arundo donax TaxID=35708 RepID=A0A0A8Y6A1_ARUDO
MCSVPVQLLAVHMLFFSSSLHLLCSDHACAAALLLSFE